MGGRAAADCKRLDAQQQIMGTGQSSERQQHIMALEVERVWPLLAMAIRSQQIAALVCVCLVSFVLLFVCCEFIMLLV